MSLVEHIATERRARLVRLGTLPARRKPQIEPIDPAPFYPQMWFYDLIEPNAPKAAPSVLTIRDVVCKYFSILPKDVESSRRQGALVYPRQIAFYLARVHTACSYPQIGRRFGDRDHTTIMHGVKRIEERMKADWTVAYDIAHLEGML